MKRTIVLLLSLLISYTTWAQISVITDERVELTSAVFRLAGIPEYTDGEVVPYNAAIDEQFEDYKDNALFEYIRKLRNEDRLGYASVAASAFYITIRDGKVSVDPTREISDLTGKGKQWASDSKFRKYVRLLNNFYQESNFAQFYNSHAQAYSEQIAKAATLFDNINGEWFANFYGVEFVAPRVYIALGNGKHNYFVNGVDGSYDIVLGAKRYYLIDTLLPVIIHEICHKYSNPITDAMYSDIEGDFATFLSDDDIAARLANIGYRDTKTVTIEWFTNLCTVMYLQDNVPLLAGYQAAKLRDNGFIWLPATIKSMEEYSTNRELYPALSNYAPKIVQCINEFGSNYSEYKMAYLNSNPQVVEVSPTDLQTLVNNNGEVKVRFSKPMMIYAYTLGMPQSVGEGYTKVPMQPDKEPYWSDETTFVFYVDIDSWDSTAKYVIELQSEGFMTSDYTHLKDNYVIYFQ